MRVEFTDEELALLKEILANSRGELREEVYRTEAAEWKRALKSREAVLETLIGKLGAA